MFVHLPGQKSLGVAPDQVVAVIESINTPNIGTPLGTERTKAYIVGLRLPSGNFTVACYLHLVDSNTSCIYAADPLETTLDGYSTLEAEAIQFAESMGFMLDNMNFRARPPEDIQRLIQVLPFFYETPPRTQSFMLDDVPDVTGAPVEEAPPEPATPGSGIYERPDTAINLSDEERVSLARLLSSF